MSDVEIIVKAIDLASPNIKLIGGQFDGLKAKVTQAGAGVKGFGSQLGNFATGAKSALTSAGQAWQSIATPLNQTLEIFGKVGAAAQQAYQFISEGTQLATTAHQFDALSRSIGSTSDALLTQLKAATRGTVSDANLMASATSIMSLGLTDTSEETVRLTSLVGKLGWDMNQVTLTLANQSTMRLDSLGLSVSDVTERVDAFKEAGYSADQAFKFAILEAGEAKVELVGDAAETAAGKLKILEANAANFGNSFKMSFGENFIANLNAASDGLFEAEESASSFGETLANIATNVSFLGFIRFAKEGIEDLGEASQNAEGRISGMGGIVEQIAPGLKAASQETGLLADEIKYYRDEIIAASAATDGWMASLNTVTTLTHQAARERAAEATASYKASDAYAELEDKVFQTSQTYDMWEVGLRAINTEFQNQAAIIPAVTGAVYASRDAVAAYNARLGDLYITAQETEEANRLLNSGIRQTSGGLVEVSNLTEQQTDDLGRMQDAYDKAAETVRDYELGIKGANLTDEERIERIDEQRAAMALLAGNMQPLIDMGSNWVTVAGQMISFGPAVADAFTTSAAAIGMNATEIAGLQLAFGDLEPAAAEAIIKEALLRDEITRLTEQVKLKNITIYEARDAYIAFQEGLNDSSIAVNGATGSVLLMNESMVSSATTTQNLLDKFGLFPDEVGTKVTVDTAEAESRLSSLEARLAGLGSGGAPATASGGYQPGLDAPGGGGNVAPGAAAGANYIVPPGYNENWYQPVSSGEHVVVTPAGQGQGGQNITMNMYVTATDGGANISREFNYMKGMLNV
jgi:hypothetical protein